MYIRKSYLETKPLNKEIALLVLTIVAPFGVAPEGARPRSRFLPPSPIVAQTLRFGAPAAQGVLLEPVRIFKTESVTFLPFEYRGRDIAATTAGRRQICTISTTRTLEHSTSRTPSSSGSEGELPPPTHTHIH